MGAGRAVGVRRGLPGYPREAWVAVGGQRHYAPALRSPSAPRRSSPMAGAQGAHGRRGRRAAGLAGMGGRSTAPCARPPIPVCAPPHVRHGRGRRHRTAGAVGVRQGLWGWEGGQPHHAPALRSPSAPRRARARPRPRCRLHAPPAQAGGFARGVGTTSRPRASILRLGPPAARLAPRLLATIAPVEETGLDPARESPPRCPPR